LYDTSETVCLDSSVKRASTVSPCCTLPASVLTVVVPLIT
jgi:hypothetical protein